MVSGRCPEGVSRVSGGYLLDDVSEGQVRRSQVRIGKVKTSQVRTGQDRCLEGVLRVSGRCLKAV